MSAINVRGTRVELAPDLRENLDQADAVAESIKTTIDRFIAQRGVEAPVERRYLPVWEPPPEPRELDLAVQPTRGQLRTAIEAVAKER